MGLQDAERPQFQQPHPGGSFPTPSGALDFSRHFEYEEKSYERKSHATRELR